MKRIEDDLRCMSLEIGSKKKMEWKKRREKFARRDGKDVGWHFVNVGRKRSTRNQQPLVIWS